MKKLALTIILTFLIILPVTSQNKPEKERWLKDAGFGMFIHWSMDSQLGIVISHSTVAASEDYTNRYFNELPKTFNPTDFDADRMAVLAKLAGMKYMVFTAKHHSGFCMWDTETTPFNIMNTPYKQDIVKDYIEACRKYGLKVGLYFSPEDFWFLNQNDELIRRTNIDDISDDLRNKYIDYNQRQCRELLTKYGPVDVMFFDGGEGSLIQALKPFCWNINQDLLITRGELQTPEQYLPGITSERVWESCITMGTQWQFKPTNESYKSGGQIIKMLVETRSKGGALLLNIGPDAYGNIPFEQDRNLREVAAWYFINHEAVDKVRPWIITNEGNIWFCQSKEGQTVYAVLFGQTDWARGERREFTLHSVKATDQTKVSVLGQNDKIVEYMNTVDPVSRYSQDTDGLNISVVRAQRIYNNHKWPNPIVIKLENVEKALIPPVIRTLENIELEGGNVTFKVMLDELGDAEKVGVAIQYRKAPTTLNERVAGADWIISETMEVDKKGEFKVI
ncbi:MAG: alpha-L-fucosidase, partial [Cyclobacteriaceae bacterium]